MITVAVSYGYIQDNDSPANWEADYLVDTVFELSRLLGLE
jgi:phosphoglycolate phosphatase-like HAD superfamily hydrolase